VPEEQSTDLRSLRSWTFITRHAQVLLAVARDPAATVAELAATTEITERSAYRILADLQQGGYVRRRKVGRRNAYEINPSLPLRDPTVENERVHDLLSLLSDADVEGHRQPHRAVRRGGEGRLGIVRALPQRCE
jgi:DNA-binding transcriptional ArsR family regulator